MLIVNGNLHDYETTLNIRETDGCVMFQDRLHRTVSHYWTELTFVGTNEIKVFLYLNNQKYKKKLNFELIYYPYEEGDKESELDLVMTLEEVNYASDYLGEGESFLTDDDMGDDDDDLQ